MSRDRGFTLIELMVVIVIIAITLAVAVPGLRSFVAGQRVKALAFDLTSDLLLARSEALKRGTAITVKPNSAGWYAGWKVDVGAVNLMSREASPEAVLFDNAPDDGITFDVNGRVSSQIGRLGITVRSTSSVGQDRCVELDPSGRARVNRGACT